MSSFLGKGIATFYFLPDAFTKGHIIRSTVYHVHCTVTGQTGKNAKHFKYARVSVVCLPSYMQWPFSFCILVTSDDISKTVQFPVSNLAIF